MKLNTDKCRLIVLGYKLEQGLVRESNDVKLLGITIGGYIKFGINLF